MIADVGLNPVPAWLRCYAPSADLDLAQPILRPGGTVTWVTVALYAIPMALASGLGGVPFFFTDGLSRRSEGIANAIAAGVMLAVSFDLLNEPFCMSKQSLSSSGDSAATAAKTVLGVIAGSWFIWSSQGAQHSWSFTHWLDHFAAWLSWRHAPRVAWLESYERRHGEVRLGKLSGAPARKAIMFVLIMTVHSFGEGFVLSRDQHAACC